MDKRQEFLKRILATFRIEAEENINIMSADLIELEKGCTDARKEEILEVVFRAAHSLKGASRAVNLSEIERLCHAFEDVMSAIRSNEIKLSAQILDLLNRTVDLLNEALFSDNGNVSPELSNTITNHIENLSLAEAGLEEEIVKPAVVNKPEKIILKEKTGDKTQKTDKEIAPEISSLQEKTAKKPTIQKQKFERRSTNETIRISTQKLDHVLTQAEEMLSLKLNATQRIENLNSISRNLETWKKEASLVHGTTVNLKQCLDRKEKERALSNEEKEFAKILQFHDWTRSYIEDIEKEFRDIQNYSRQEAYSSEVKIETLLDDVKELITVPFSTLLDGFPKMVRDIAKDLDKKINFNVEGDDIEIDRRILEKLRSPLMHILRNSIDYGIEDNKTRLKHNKSEKGNITLKIEQFQNNTVEILISDDGAGINREKLKKLYIKNKNIADSDVEKIDESAYLNYIFSSGVSTSDIVTDLSGRGLGLAIVQETIDQLGGIVNVESEEGKSTTFRIILPVSIVTFRGVLIESSGREFIVPTAKVERILRLDKRTIKTVKNKVTVQFNNEIIPVLNLNEILEIPEKKIASEYIQIIVLKFKNKYFGFIIDSVIGEHEVLVKNFNKQLTHVRNIAGATVLGSGKVVPILNISDLFKNTLSKDSSQISVLSDDIESDKKKQKSILVVEDSITSRTLLKNILEASGNLVTTAIDGVDGFTKLKEGSFDAVISDIEMPRMNGFDLTAKIRADKECSTIPVVLVTSLVKREHRERGIDVGANAYIVKSSFDQNNLLEILERLI